MSKIIHLAEHVKQDPTAKGNPIGGDAEPTAPKELPAAARRALQEAEERRLAAQGKTEKAAGMREVNGRGGLDPVRYGDWEIKGITSDF